MLFPICPSFSKVELWCVWAWISLIYPVWNLLSLLNIGLCLFPNLEKQASNIFQPHSSFSLGILMKWMSDVLLLFYRFLRISSFYSAYFFCLLFNWVISTHLSSSLQILSSSLLSNTLRILKFWLSYFQFYNFYLDLFLIFLLGLLICFKSASNYCPGILWCLL